MKISFLSVGDYRNRYLAQEDESINGKIIKKLTSIILNFETISKGHRNPQGLLFDKSKNIIIETEHGPFGGDEINIIDMNLYNQKYSNYGCLFLPQENTMVEKITQKIRRNIRSIH